MKGRFMKNKTFWLGAAAIVMAGSMTAQSAMAYFTTYVKAKGGYEITLGSETEIEEKVKDMTKEEAFKMIDEAVGSAEGSSEDQ